MNSNIVTRTRNQTHNKSPYDHLTYIKMKKFSLIDIIFNIVKPSVDTQQCHKYFQSFPGISNKTSPLSCIACKKKKKNYNDNNSAHI